MLVTFLKAKCAALTRISEANFGAKPSPRPPDTEVAPMGAKLKVCGEKQFLVSDIYIIGIQFASKVNISDLITCVCASSLYE